MESIALSAYIGKKERFKISGLNFHLKKLENGQIYSKNIERRK